MSKELGYSQSLVGLVESGASNLSQEFMLKLSDTYGVSADWLLYGRGDMLMPLGGFGGGESGPRVDPPNRSQPLSADLVVDGTQFVRIRRYDIDVSAGNGLGQADEADADPMLLPRDWLVRRRLSPDLCVVVRTKGDSMAPGIPDGALLLLHCAERLDASPGIYALTWRGEAYVKRIAIAARDAAGRPSVVLLVSDNPAYAPITIAEPEPDSFRIVGRVRGVFAFL